MADIKQAAKWMQEGKRVRRRGWPDIPDLGMITFIDAGKIRAKDDAQVVTT